MKYPVVYTATSKMDNNTINMLRILNNQFSKSYVEK